jgi:hypothetical protein
MFGVTTKIATTILLIPLTCGGVCLLGYSSMQAGEMSPDQAPPPKDTDAKKAAEKTNKMFPDGLVHDFGPVLRGRQLTHTFRIVNTSDIPLRITSVRCMT